MSDNQGEIRPVYKIVNVVATSTVDIQEKIDLIKIAQKHKDVEYNPERFPGLVMRIKEPSGTVLVFSTGKFVITGLKKTEDAEKVIKKVIKNIKKSGINVSNPQIQIVNLVASGDLYLNIDLNMAAVLLEYAMYEPEVFPGLILRMKEPKAVFLIFSTGKIVCTGITQDEFIKEAMNKLYIQIKDLGISRDFNDEGNDLES